MSFWLWAGAEALKAISRKNAADEDLRSAYQQAYNIDLQKKAYENKALNDHNALINQYLRSESTNLALLSGFQGRDDNSVRAFLESNRERATKDTDAVDYNKNVKVAMYNAEANEIRTPGKDNKNLATINNMATEAGGIYKNKTI